MFYGKNMECPKKFKVPKFKRKKFFSSIVEKKMMSLPPLLLTDLDKIFIGGTSHHALLPCKMKFFLGITNSPLKEFRLMVHTYLPYNGNATSSKTIFGVIFF